MDKTSFDLKVADFGMATFTETLYQHSYKGTTTTMAPEIIEPSDKDRHYNARQADLFACAVVLFIMTS